MLKYMKNTVSDGFTLIEILLVLAIFAMTVALVAPAVTSGIKTVRLRGTAKKITTMLKYARNLAISERKVYYSRVLPDEFILVAGKEGKLKKKITIPEEVEIKASYGDTIIFYPSGNSSGGLLKVRDRKGEDFYSISVEPLSGRARVEVL